MRSMALILIISTPLEGLKSSGDFWNFFSQAGMGRPFFAFWVEFPPLFPWISRLAYLITGGREHSYIYALVIFFSIIQAVNVYLFGRIVKRSIPNGNDLQPVLIYGFLTIALFYTWAYFDILAIFF